MTAIYYRHENGQYSMVDKEAGISMSGPEDSPVAAELTAEEYTKDVADMRASLTAKSEESVKDGLELRQLDYDAAAAKLEAIGLTADEIRALSSGVGSA